MRPNSSHANVHSPNRPHHCPVQGCARGEGGKGFKRKHEMIRHGLVHEAPGYVCPFCHEREHKYPRPDYLARYTFTLSAENLNAYLLADTFMCTTPRRIRPIPSYVRYWDRSGKKKVDEDGSDCDICVIPTFSVSCRFGRYISNCHRLLTVVTSEFGRSITYLWWMSMNP